MHRLGKTLVSAFAGTSAMTASSALMSLLPHEEFREPQQLAKLVGRILPILSRPAKVVAGWGTHYAMGLLFAAVYVELWEKREIEHSIKNGVILGLQSGLLGFLAWKATFSVHPLPHNKRKLDFYLQRTLPMSSLPWAQRLLTGLPLPKSRMAILLLIRAGAALKYCR